jgi:hypothetical protein
MHGNGINPYQPVVLESARTGDNVPCEVSFRLTYALLYHGESQYLLHWHPRRLLFGSLLMIAVSCTIFFFSMQFGTVAFVIGLIGSMIASSLIYSALVRDSKFRIRGRLWDHGLVHGATCTVVLDDKSLRLLTPSEEFQWAKNAIKFYRTRKGLLLCPEPLLFVFVPKHNDSSPAAYNALRRDLQQASRDK